MPVLFLNADLDILIHQNLQPLIDEIGNRASLIIAGLPPSPLAGVRLSFPSQNLSPTITAPPVNEHPPRDPTATMRTPEAALFLTTPPTPSAGPASQNPLNYCLDPIFAKNYHARFV